MNLISNYLLSNEFIKKFLENCYENLKVKKVILLKRGIYSDLYQIIDINRKYYIFKIYREQFKQKYQLKIEIEVVNFLNKKNFYISEYIKSKFNTFYVKINLFNITRFAVLMNYKVGEELNFNIKKNIILYSTNVAHFHNLTKDFIDNKNIKFKSILNKKSLFYMKNNIINFMNKKTHVNFFKDIFDFICIYKSSNNIKYLSKNIIHGDLHGGNVLKSNNKLIFIDFDFTNYDYLLIDIATYYWSCIIRDKEHEWEVFIKKYINNSILLQKEELKYLEFFVIIRELYIFNFYIKSTKFLGKNLIDNKIIENKIKFINYIKRKIK